MRIHLYLVVLALMLSCVMSKKNKQRRGVAEDKDSSSQQTFNVSECESVSLTEKTLVSFNPMLFGIPVRSEEDLRQIHKGFGGISSILHVCHPLRMTIVGEMSDNKISLLRLTVYLTHDVDRLELYLNISSIQREPVKDTYILVQTNANGLIRRKRPFGTDEWPAFFNVTVDNPVTRV